MTNSISSAKCPSVLTSGKYGMSQHRSIVDNSKEYIFVKLTDSAFRAIEEYQRNLQSKRLGQGQCAKIQFIGNAGVIHFPTADGGGGPPDGRKFGFAIDDVEGSLECIQQTGAELDVLGALNYRMRIHANDDVYDTTRTKMAIAEETEKSKCIREIKPNQTDIGRKVKRPVSAASLQAYANGLNSGNNNGINGSSNNNNVSYLGVNSHSNNSSNSRNKSLNNHSPPFNGNGSGSSSLSSSNVSSRLGSAVNSRSSPNPITMGGSGTTGSNNRYGSPSNLSSSSSTSCLPSLMTSASSLSSTLAGGITTGYQSASCRNSPPPIVVTSLQKNSKGGGGNGSGRGSLLGIKSSSSKGSGSSSGNNSKLPDVSRRKIRERLIHLLALKPFKKPELYARLQNEGLAQRERQLITNILKDISTLSRDNTYNLRRSLWNDVDENWPYFTEQELQQLKRRKPQNLTPPMSSDAGSSTSGQSPTSSTHTGSPPPLVAGGTVVGCGLKRASLEPDLYDGALLSGVQPKKQRISHYKKDMLGGGGLTASTSAVRVPGNTYQHQSRNSLAYSPPSYNSGGSNGSISNQVQTNDENSGNSDLTFNVLNNVDDLMAHASIGYASGGDQQQSIQTRSNGSSKTSLNKFAPTTKSITSGSLKEKRGSACGSSRETTTATGIRRSNNSPTPYANNFVPESKSNSSDGNSRPHVSQQLLHHNLHKSTSSNSVFGHNNSQHEETVNNRSRHHSSGRDSSKHSKSTSALQGQSPQKQCSNNNSNKYQQNNCQQQQQQSMMLPYTNQHLVDTPPQAQCTILNTPFVTYRQPQHSSPTQQQIDAAADSFSMTTSSTTDASRYDFSNYTPITSIEQRRQYKTEFESDYDEYRKLLGQVDSVAQRFREMAESLKKVRQGCQDYYKIKNQILNEYHRVRNEEAINRDKQRFDYLHEKLAHIKQLVMDYDKKLTSGAIPPPSHPSQSQKIMIAAQHVVAANPSQQVANVPAPAPISTQILTGDTGTTLSPMLQNESSSNHSTPLATIHKQKSLHRTHNRHHQQQQQQPQQQQQQQQQQHQHQHRQQQQHYHNFHNNNNNNNNNNSNGVASIDLEQYIEAMEARTTANERTPETDVWTQLQQKESDILLAAELGKALLEKNEELVKQQEKLIEDYSAKIEKLEQEKHILRQKLAIAEEESEQRVLELQTDLNELKEKLQAQENVIRQAEKEKTLLIEELSNQNARLTEQIQEAHATEIKLMAQIQELKDQYNYRNTSLQEHVNSLESIKCELNLTTEKRHELEKRLQLMREEKENLGSALEEASDRIHMLERHAREQETKLETTLQTLERAQRENNVLSERLGADNYTGSHGKKSLQFEMECDEDEGSFSDSGKSSQIWIEARSVFIQLKSLVDSLKIGHDDDSGLNSDLSLDLESMDNTISSALRSVDDGNGDPINFRPGMLSSMSDELTRLLLNLDAGNFKKMLDQTRNLVLEQEDEIKRSHQLIQQLESKLTITNVELHNVKEERDQARGDLTDSSDRDELLAKAQKERDNANERRTKAEIELAKTRVELMQANSQLLESIQQKVELSQQLEQWQMDMQELIEEQMRSKMINNRKTITNESQTSNTSAAANLAKRFSSYKFWSLFQR